MGKGKKKPRAKMDPRAIAGRAEKAPKKEEDWGFDEIARSKTRRRG